MCVCSCFCLCLTSGTVFLFCSLTPRVSMLRLASKHSGHTRLVLLSKVFEHFAQMACRRTERERDGIEKAAQLLTVNCPKENFHLSFRLLSLHPFIFTSCQTMPKCLLFHLCSPLRRTCSGVCALWSWRSRCSLYTFASLSPFSWNSSGKCKKTKNTQESCVKVFSLFGFSSTERMSDGFILCLSGCLSFISPFY